jgi:hypothetical protein
MPSEVQILPPPPQLTKELDVADFAPDGGKSLETTWLYAVPAIGGPDWGIKTAGLLLSAVRGGRHRTRLPKTEAGVAQLVELQPSKLDVASSSLVSRSTPLPAPASLCRHAVFKSGHVPFIDGVVGPT